MANWDAGIRQAMRASAPAMQTPAQIAAAAPPMPTIPGLVPSVFTGQRAFDQQTYLPGGYSLMGGYSMSPQQKQAYDAWFMGGGARERTPWQYGTQAPPGRVPQAGGTPANPNAPTTNPYVPPTSYQSDLGWALQPTPLSQPYNPRSGMAAPGEIPAWHYGMGNQRMSSVARAGAAPVAGGIPPWHYADTDTQRQAQVSRTPIGGMGFRR